VQALTVKADQIRRQAAEDAAREKTRKADTAAALPAEYPRLVPLSKSEKSPWAGGAENVRRLLGDTFPGVKFRATSESYSGGSSIDVRWIDGPTSEEVKKLSDMFQQCDFDGMQDLETYRASVFPKVFGGAHYVFENREMSENTRAILTAWESALLSESGTYEERDNLAHRLFCQSPLPAGAVVRAVERKTRAEMDAAGHVYGPAAGWKIIYDVPAAVAKPAAVRVQTAAPAGDTAAAVGATVTENPEKNGIEIRFPDRPDSATLERLKAAGWRWSRFACCWYTFASDAARQFAASLVGQSTANA